MKIEDFKKSREELQEEINKNKSQLYINAERAKAASINQLDNKLLLTFACALIPYVAITIVFVILVKVLGASTIANILPPFISQIIFTGVPLGIGALRSKLIFKKQKIKERLKSFSKAKTETEKIEEEIYNQIELEKLNNRNKINIQAINSLDYNESILQFVSDKYNIEEKNQSSNKEETEQKLNVLSTIIEKEYNELDILSTKKTLNTHFSEIRDNYEKVTAILYACMTAGLMTMAVTFTPLFMLREVYTYSSLFTNLLHALAPLAVGILGACGYRIKRNKDSEKAFDNLNSTLGENQLPKNTKDIHKETKEYKRIIEDKINHISDLKVKFQETKRNLETFMTEEEIARKKRSEILSKPLSDIKITEETKKDILEHPEKYADSEARARRGLIYTDDEYERYVEETLNRPLPSEENHHKLVRRFKSNKPNEKK